MGEHSSSVSSASGTSASAPWSWGDLPEFVWEESPSTLSDFAENFESPHLVRLEDSQSSSAAAAPAFTLGELVDVNRPFLAFSRRRRTRVYAENLEWDAKKRIYVPKGHVLEIPKDYMGEESILILIITYRN